MLVQPQPIGIFAGAAAHLLLPSITTSFASWTEHEEALEQKALEQLLSGNAHIEVPEAWRFFVAAAQGDIDQANRLLTESAGAMPDELYFYNQFVLRPDLETWQCLPSRLRNEVLQCLAQVVAFAYGLSSEVPSPEQLTDELAAWTRAVIASKQLEQDDYIAARQSLVAAIASARNASPLLSAILLAQSAQVALQGQLPIELIENELQQAIDIAQGCRLPDFQAELQMQLGMLMQRSAANDRSKLLAAVRAYQSALQLGITEQKHPETFAELQNNLGLCYLSISSNEASAQLRTGIAIQSFRRALEALNDRSHTDLWARINVNLANALQYAPSSHPAENLIQAVEIYEQVLQVRSRARDPVAYALTILNQANALAHLGIFKPALEKASEAYKLFQWYDEVEAANSARELVENVNAHIEAAKKTGSLASTSQPAVDTGETACEEELQHGPV